MDADGDGTYTTTRFAYDGWRPGGNFIGNENWDVWAVLDNGDNLRMRYLHGDQIDQILARVDSHGTTAHYYTDHIGSVRHMTDHGGVVRNELQYDAFGNITSQSDPSFGDRYTYASREFDVETGFYHNRARYYFPEIGAWTSEDPAGFAAGDSNLYRYVNNSPVNATDPSGFEFSSRSDITSGNPVDRINGYIATARFVMEVIDSIFEPVRITADVARSGVAIAHSKTGGEAYIPSYRSETARRLLDTPYHDKEELLRVILAAEVEFGIAAAIEIITLKLGGGFGKKLGKEVAQDLVPRISKEGVAKTIDTSIKANPKGIHAIHSDELLLIDGKNFGLGGHNSMSNQQ